MLVNWTLQIKVSRDIWSASSSWPYLGDLKKGMFENTDPSSQDILCIHIGLGGHPGGMTDGCWLVGWGYCIIWCSGVGRKQSCGYGYKLSIQFIAVDFSFSPYSLFNISGIPQYLSGNR